MLVITMGQRVMSVRQMSKMIANDDFIDDLPSLQR